MSLSLFLNHVFTFYLLIFMNHLPGFSNLVFCLSVWQLPPPVFFLSVTLSIRKPFPSSPATLPSIPPTTPPPTRHENGAPLGVPGLSPVWHTLLWSAVSGAKHPTKLTVWRRGSGKAGGGATNVERVWEKRDQKPQNTEKREMRSGFSQTKFTTTCRQVFY